jgi:hypothetical protein
MPLISTLETEWLKNPSVNFTRYMTDLVTEQLNESHREMAKTEPLYAWENQIKNKVSQIKSAINLGMGLLTHEEWEVYKQVLFIKLKAKKIPSVAGSEWRKIIEGVDQEYINAAT